MPQDYKPWLTVRDTPAQEEAKHRKKGRKTVRTHSLLGHLERKTCFVLEWSLNDTGQDARTTYWPFN